MTQAQPSYQYGRQGHSYTGGYATQNAPPQQNPQRYFTPNQQQGICRLFMLHIDLLIVEDQPYPQQPSSPDYPSQRPGPAPFYVLPLAQQQQQQQHSDPHANSQQYPQRDPTPRIPSNTKPPPLQTGTPPPNTYPTQAISPPPAQYPAPQPQTGHRPQSTYSNPQELATNAYDSPVNQPNSAYSASVYSQDDLYAPSAPANQQPPTSQQQYQAYVPPQQSQPQPAYEPPAPPPGGYIPPPVQMNAGYPVISQDARQTLPSQGPQGQYKPYQRPGTSEGRPGAPSAPPGAPADFYRQSAAY
jgi:signal transducing adaptor molecule